MSRRENILRRINEAGKENQRNQRNQGNQGNQRNLGAVGENDLIYIYKIEL